MLTLGTGVGGGVVIDGDDLPRRARPGRRARPRHAQPRRPALPGQLPQPRLHRGLLLGAGARARRDRARPRQARQPARAVHRGRRQGHGPRRWSRRPRRATPTRCWSSTTSRACSGIAIAGYVNVFEPDRLAIGGGLSRAEPPVLRPRGAGGGDARAARAAGGGANDRAGPGRRGCRGDRRRRARRTGDRGIRTHCAILQVSHATRPKGPNDDQRRPARRALASTRSARSRWTPCRRRTPAIPGAPMALAPLAYLLYTRVMKHNPANADWFDRDRFVLSAGHASMLLYSTPLPDRLRADARRPQELPPARQPDRGPPRARRRRRDRGHHRPARPGHLHGGRPRAGRAHAGRALQPAGPRPDRPPHLHDRERRRHAGGRGLGGLLAGRPPRARQARSPSTTTTTSSSPARPRWPSPRTCGEALRGLRLARPGPRRGHRRSSASSAAIDGRRRGDRPALADHAAHAHRLRLAQQAGHRRRRTARRSARRRCASPRRPTAGTRTPTSSCPDEVLEHFRETAVERGAAGRGRVERARRGLPRRASRRAGTSSRW